MLDFPITINGCTFMASDIIPYIRQCNSETAIELIITKTLCTRTEAEEIVSDIKNMYNYKYSKYSKRDKDEFTICPQCKTEYSFKIDHCTRCGYSTDKYKDRIKSLQYEEPEEKNICVPKCPTCNSTNIRKILGTKKAASIIGFGILSNNIGKTYECLNCRYKW